MKKLTLTAALFGCLTCANATIIADLDADYIDWQNNGGPIPTSIGWDFEWNPNGETLIGGTWTNMPQVGANDFRGSGTDSTVQYSGGSPQIVGFNDTTSNTNLSLGVGNVYGGANSAISADGFSHYAIASYTVQPGEAGLADVISTTTGGPNGSSELILLLNGSIQNSFGNGNGSFTFTEQMALAEGDKVSFAFVNLQQDVDTNGAHYVASLPAVNKNSVRIYPNFQIDVAVIPEPSALGLIAVFGAGLVSYRRRFND